MYAPPEPLSSAGIRFSGFAWFNRGRICPDPEPGAGPGPGSGEDHGGAGTCARVSESRSQASVPSPRAQIRVTARVGPLGHGSG
jgi:hypothetical protein